MRWAEFVSFGFFRLQSLNQAKCSFTIPHNLSLRVEMDIESTSLVPIGRPNSKLLQYNHRPIRWRLSRSRPQFLPLHIRPGPSCMMIFIGPWIHTPFWPRFGLSLLGTLNTEDDWKTMRLGQGFTSLNRLQFRAQTGRLR